MMYVLKPVLVFFVLYLIISAVAVVVKIVFIYFNIRSWDESLRLFYMMVSVVASVFLIIDERIMRKSK